MKIPKENLCLYERAIIVAGSRGWDDYETFSRLMAPSFLVEGRVKPDLVFISGEAPTGADNMIIRWCEEHGADWCGFPADWSNTQADIVKVRFTKTGRPYNALAGFQRNQDMADNATKLWAFYDGKSPGTRDMIKRAECLKLAVWVIIIDKGRVDDPKTGI